MRSEEDGGGGRASGVRAASAGREDGRLAAAASFKSARPARPEPQPHFFRF